MGSIFPGAARHPRNKWITPGLAKLGLQNLLVPGSDGLKKEDSQQIFYTCLEEAVYGKEPFNPNSVDGFKRAWDAIEYDSRVPMDFSTGYVNSDYRWYLKKLVKDTIGNSPEVNEVTRELLTAWSGSPQELIDTIKSAIS